MKKIKIFFKNWWKLVKVADSFHLLMLAIFLGWFIALFFTDGELE